MRLMNTKQLTQRFLQDIENKIIQDENNRLPSEPELMKHYDVTRYTLRMTLSTLVDQGIVYQVQGNGTFVRNRAKNDFISLDQTSGLTEEARRLGKELKTIYAHLSTIQTKDALYLPDGLEFSDEEELYFVERLRYLGRTPFVLEYSYYRKKFVPYLNQEIVDHSIYEYIKQALKLNLGFADKFISCEACGSAESEALQLTPSSPVLVLKDEAYLNSGEVFNFSKLYYHPQTQFFMLAKMD